MIILNITLLLWGIYLFFSFLPFHFLLRKRGEPLLLLFNQSSANIPTTLQLPLTAFSPFIINCASLDMLCCPLCHSCSVFMSLSPYTGRIRTKQSIKMLERGFLLFMELSAFGPFLCALKGQTWRMSHSGQLRNATVASVTE